jgi:peroxiredoxin
LSEAEQAGAEIIAVSPDPNERSHEMAQRLHLGFRFVADHDLAVTRRYGLIHARGGANGEDVPTPTTAVLDRTGAVRWLWISDNFQVRPDAAEVRRAVRALE